MNRTDSTHLTSRARFAFVRQAHMLRTPLAAVSMAAGVSGLLLNLFNVRLSLGSVGATLGTHPVTALMIILLSFEILLFRLGKKRPLWRLLLLISGIVILGWNLFLPDQLHALFSNWSAVADSRMGTDTTLLLGALVLSMLLAGKNNGLGGAFAAFAVFALLFSFMEHSFNVYFLETHLALSTLVALIPACFAVLTIYAHHPVMRLFLIGDAIGARTRFLFGASCFLPWFGGLVIYRIVDAPVRAFPVEAAVLSLIICAMTAIVLYSGRMQEKGDSHRRMLERHMAHVAHHDALTGVLNREGTQSHLNFLWRRFVIEQRSVGVILLDIDYFKKINDSYGHDVGDKVLVSLCQQIRPFIRSDDALGRWGGEEFLILVDGAQIAGATAVCQRIREAILEMHAPDGRPFPCGVTASFGVSVLLETDTGVAASLKRADLALYRAKDCGRDQVQFYENDDQGIVAA
ncbi:GGDEF domain-containing protein [Yoonia maritima]|nr:GGDEF domain-containing protein [Yoonia maritima]